MTIRHTVEPFYACLGAVLRRARHAADLRQSDIAECLGVNSSTISYYEEGKNRLRVLEFVQICEAMELNAADLLTEAVAEAFGLTEPGHPHSVPAKRRVAKKQRGITS